METKPKLKPVILDRSRLESYAACPMQGYLNTLWDGVKAQATGFETFPHEKKMLVEAEPKLIEAIKKVALQSKDSKIASCGTEIHALIEKAFIECKNDTSIIPEWFVENLPKVKPNIAPMAIRHAKHAADMLSEFHVNVIGLELQIALTVYPEKDNLPGVVITMRLDLLGSGQNSLHVMDWKTGYKQRSNSETADSFQAQCSAAILFELPEYKDINTIHFWYFETMFGTKAYARFERNAEHPRLPHLTVQQAVRSRVMSAVDLIIAGNKECWPLEDTCCFCDMIQFCPYADMSAKAIADNPKAYVDKMVVLEALLKDMKSAATTWIKGKGAIQGTKCIFTKKQPTERFTTEFQDISVSKLQNSDDSELEGHFKN